MIATTWRKLQKLLEPADVGVLYGVVKLENPLLMSLQSDPRLVSRPSTSDTLPSVLALLLLLSATGVSYTCAAAMHDQDPVFKQWSRSKRMTEVLKQLGMSQPVPVQSMYIFKASLLWTSPGLGGSFC